jgi:hypothetical protein
MINRIQKAGFVAFSVVLFLVSFINTAKAQKLYTSSSGEWIFQSGVIEKNDERLNTNLRFTLWFHTNENVHFDLGNYVGLFSGIAIRNIGFITDENDLITKYRSYNLGIPLALKIGSFKDEIFVFGGGEYEWMFHFKQKTFDDGVKRKHAEWFSDRTPSFIPSLFAGIQFPHGLQLKFKYYLKDFLNHTFKDSGDFSDYTAFTKTRLWYISFSIQMKNSKLKKTVAPSEDVACR